MALKNGRTSAALQTILVGSVIPPGVIQAFGGGTVPSGWLLCDGSTASRSAYSALFAAVGIVHGQGDGSTTFHLPDLRGRFLRGADNMGTGAAARDPDAAGRTAANTGGATGNTVGSVQDAQTLSHTHIQNAHQHVSPKNQGGNTGANYPYGSVNIGWVVYNGHPAGNTASPHAYTSSVASTNQNTGGNETRPQNANASYIIKV